MVTAGRAIGVGNLPSELTSFVGRRGELAEVERLLADARLVTLTGVGGVGKSRLALRVAARRYRSFRNGVWLIELASVRDADLVAHTVAEALRIGEQSGRAPLAMLSDFLRERQLLLVLDNCEHLPDACAVLAERLLHAAPELKILATSRQSLGVAGEHLWPVPPLGSPDPDRSTPDRGKRGAAVELFADRAAAVLPDFTITPDTERDVARVCHRLDGIPLAIELAAVWLRTLALPQLAAELDDRFGLLTGGTRAAPPRHQTLRAAVEWSYELCTPPQRLLWARASVFAGGLDLAAAEEVCATAELPRNEVLAVLDGLVDKSVLLREDRNGQVRFRLLETLREYGLHRLREAGEEDELRRCHRDYYARIADQLDAQWYGPDQLNWYARLHAEHANLRAALEYCVSQPAESRAGLRMATDLWFYWYACGQLREGRHWLDRALAAESGPSRERAAALAVNGYLAIYAEDAAVGETILNEAYAVARDLEDVTARARAATGLGTAAGRRSDPTRTRQLFAEAFACFEALPERDSWEMVGRAGWAMANVLKIDPDAGLELCVECERSSESSGDLWLRSWAHFGLAQASWHLGRPDEATRYGQQCLREKQLFADAVGIVAVVERLAWFAAAAADHERAAVLLGAAEGRMRSFGLRGFAVPQFADPHEACETQARAILGDVTYEAAYRRGTELGLDATIAFALGEEQAAAAPAAEPDGPRSVLSRRERDVVELIAEGLSNKQIAAKLVIAQRTAEGHVEHVLAKLGFSSRAQIAAWVTARRAAGDGGPRA